MNNCRNVSRPVMNRFVASSRAAPVGMGASAPSRRRWLAGALFPVAITSRMVRTLSPGFDPRDRYAIHPLSSDPTTRNAEITVGGSEVTETFDVDAEGTP